MMRDSIARGDSILEADVAFHPAISTAAQNELLHNAAQLLRNLLRQWIYFNLALPGVSAIALKHHQGVYRAILQQKPAFARRAMRKHLSETMALAKHSIKREAQGKTPLPSRR
jgi:GntR family transcriptional repressor for pyruvate dehydrogenase complex